MADLFSVTAPLAIRFPNGERQIMIERFAHRDGVCFLPPFWTETKLADALRFVPGPIKGGGPWKAGDAIITVLGCHGTDAELAGELSSWLDYLAQRDEPYPERDTLDKSVRDCLQADAGG
jgi:hypothetical protein